MADIIRAEQQDGRRVLHEDDHVIAFVPYFARYAYEVYVVPKRRVAHVFDLNDAEVASLAGALSAVTVRFDNLWRMSFPYVQVLHQAPTDGGDYERVPFLHRVSSAAAPAAPAQVPGRARDRRRQLRVRHVARSQGRRAARAAAPALQARMTGLRDPEALVAHIRARARGDP